MRCQCHVLGPEEAQLTNGASPGPVATFVETTLGCRKKGTNRRMFEEERFQHDATGGFFPTLAETRLAGANASN